MANEAVLTDVGTAEMRYTKYSNYKELKMSLVLWIILGVVVLLAAFLWATYNGLVKLNVRVQEAWSDITVQLKRRADLIPNLIEAVKGYASHEKEVFEKVT